MINNILLLKIKDYINTNYIAKGELTFKQTNGGYIVNCDGDVIVKNRNIEKLTDGFEWGEVKGDFYCRHCNNLKSLEGVPDNVGGCCYCDDCYNLTSLEGSPKKVGGGFYCSSCRKL